MQKFRVHSILVLSLFVALLAQYVKSSCSRSQTSEEYTLTYSDCGSIQVTITQYRCANQGTSCHSFHYGGPDSHKKKGINVKVCGPSSTSKQTVQITQADYPDVDECFHGKEFEYMEIDACHCQLYEVIKSTTSDTIIHTI